MDVQISQIVRLWLIHQQNFAAILPSRPPLVRKENEVLTVEYIYCTVFRLILRPWCYASQTKCEKQSTAWKEKGRLCWAWRWIWARRPGLQPGMWWSLSFFDWFSVNCMLLPFSLNFSSACRISSLPLVGECWGRYRLWRTDSSTSCMICSQLGHLDQWQVSYLSVDASCLQCSSWKHTSGLTEKLALGLSKGKLEASSCCAGWDHN